MTQEQRLLLIGLYINAALYLAGCFTAGVITGNPFAWKCAIASAGFSYVAYFVQVRRSPRRLQAFAVLVAIAVGIAAGLALL